MRATQHSSREWGSARHNDRDFDIRKAGHIDPEKQESNFYGNYFGDEGLSFRDAELLFYQQTFEGMIEDINARAIASKHPSRCTTAQKLLESKRTCPEEVIYQIGDKDSSASVEQLKAVYNAFWKWHREKYGNHVVILDLALHTDEKTPHIHARKVWIYKSPKGFAAIGQEKALEQLGYKLPDPTKPRGRSNNRKMIYTRECREKWLEICRSMSIEVEEQPARRAPNEQNLRKGDYIIAEQAAKVTRLKKQAEQLQELLDQRAEIFNTQNELVSKMQQQLLIAKQQMDNLQLVANRKKQEVAAYEEQLKELQGIEEQIKSKRAELTELSDTAYRYREDIIDAGEEYMELDEAIKASEMMLKERYDHMRAGAPPDLLMELIRLVPDKTRLSPENQKYVDAMEQVERIQNKRRKAPKPFIR